MSPLTTVRRSTLIVGVWFLTGALSACSPDNIPGVYRIDIQQGNVVSQEMLDQLEPGMDRRKVRFILGTPMLTDTFNEDRWDYFYSLRTGHSDSVQRRISVFFQDDKLDRIEGDIRPAEARRPVTPRKETIVTVPPNYEGEGLLSALRPEFLGGKKKRRPVLEQSDDSPGTASSTVPEADKAPAPVVEEVATVLAAPAPAIQVPVPSADDQVYLERLFEGFGKSARGRVAAPAASEQAATGAPRVYEDDDLSIVRSLKPDAGETAEEDDGGFFKRLIERLRKTPENTQPQSGAESPASPSVPETAAP